MVEKLSEKVSDAISIGESTSKAYSLDFTDVKKVGRHLLIVSVAAALSALIDNVGSLNFGIYTTILIPIISTVLNTAMRYVKSNDEDK